MLRHPQPECPLNLTEDIPRLTQIMLSVSAIQLRYFKADLTVTLKKDKTPVTVADQLSSDHICHELSAQWPWPVLSEESLHPSWQERQTWQYYWLVDPLDGTRDFISGRPEFSINIALIHAGQPVFGYIWSACHSQGWWGVPGHGAFAIDAQSMSCPIATDPMPERVEDWRLLSSHHARFNPTQWHPRLTSNTVEFLGSSLKFCRIATGRAHLYYRKGPTGEWDTAAGQAIVEAAGGVALTLEGMQPLRYNQKESLINPNFVVAADPFQHWQNLLKP